MPTYQYECDACGHSLEAFQSITDKKMQKCPSCNQLSLQRLIGTGSGIIFKGTGFYETDYKRAGSANNGGTASKTPAESTSKETSDSKPASSGTCTTENSTKECGGAPVEEKK